MMWGCVHKWQIIAKTYDTQGEATDYLLTCEKCGVLERRTLFGKEIANTR